MNYRLLMVSLFAAMPVLVSAQGTQLVNCRTLEAAGNFIGPDEVLDNNMVCQKVKVGAAAPSKPQPPKPLPGVVISDTEPASIVDAAKESEKRVAAAREAAAAKTAGTAEPTSSTTVPDAGPAREAPASVPAVEPTTTAPASVTPEKPAASPVVSPLPASAPVAEPVTTMPTSVTPEKPAAAPTVSPSPALVPTTEPAKTAPASEKPEKPEIAPAAPAAPKTKPEMVLPAKPPASESAAAPETGQGAVPSTTAAAEPPTPAAAPASTASESVIPASTAATAEPGEAGKTVQAEVSAAPAPAATETVSAAPPGPQEAAAEPEEKANGFYDANKGANVVTVAPAAESANAGFGPAQPASPPADAAPAAEADARNTAAAAMAPPDDPNEERERVVQLGAFAKPQEGPPDPETEEHKTTFLPGDEEGFHEGQRPDCTRNITLGSLKGEKLVLGTPGWAARWIEKNQKRMPQVCFSDTPMQGAKNYLIVFYTAQAQGGASATKLANTLLTTVKETPASGMGTFTTSYGSTWHYSYDRTVGVTVLTRDEADEPHSKPGQVLYATAYSEEGVPVTKHWPGKAKKQVNPNSKKAKQIREEQEAMEQVSGDLLDQMVADIAGL